MSIANRVAARWLRAGYTGPDKCLKCRGSGFDSRTLDDCPACAGTGKASAPAQVPIQTGPSKKEISLHSSGNPSRPGGYKLVLEDATIGGKMQVEVDGEISGQIIHGKLTVFLSDGEWDGHDWQGDAFVMQDEEAKQIVLDCVAEYFGLI